MEADGTAEAVATMAVVRNRADARDKGFMDRALG
jgi:hypothetical protein